MTIDASCNVRFRMTHSLNTLKLTSYSSSASSLKQSLRSLQPTE